MGSAVDAGHRPKGGHGKKRMRDASGPSAWGLVRLAVAAIPIAIISFIVSFFFVDH